MGSGQHYFFDLLCAVPYAATIASLGQAHYAAKRAPQAERAAELASS
jgi:hypothetical protein